MLSLTRNCCKYSGKYKQCEKSVNSAKKKNVNKVKKTVSSSERK